MKIVPSLWFNYGRSDEGRSDYTSINPSFSIRVLTQLQASISGNLYREHSDRQWFGNFEDGGVIHHSFARLRYRELSMSVRLNYTMRPNLTFEFYGQPFMATGEYTNFREVSSTPEARDYDDRYTPYVPPASSQTAFNMKQLRTNTVVRWEYLPGSALYLVWAHGRFGSIPGDPDQPWRDGLGDIFDLRPDNTFLVKVAYWLAR